MGRHFCVCVLLPLLSSSLAAAQQQARIESFSPQGTVKKIRQVRVRFSEPMVPFGDPQADVKPFEIECTAKGAHRWADPRNWIYDFEEDLPAGIRCVFRLRPGLKTLAGNEIAGRRDFTLSTGGPAILNSHPYQGSQSIDEEQIFVLTLDGEPTEASVLSSVYFNVAGIGERVGVRIVSGSSREEILKAVYGTYRRELPRNLTLIQAKQTFPAGAKISLVWGRGVSTSTGVATEQDQVLPFVVRTPFTATFHCQRENPEADCVPISPMWISFSAPVSAAVVGKAVLTGPGGRRWQPKAGDSDEEEGEGRFVRDISFAGPFPEKASLKLEVPLGVKDESGRALSNAGSFPLTVATDEYPPLAKFASDFGILESKAGSLLPVTLRNLEDSVSARMLRVEGGEGAVDPPEKQEKEPTVDGQLEGRVMRIPSDQVGQMLHWIGKVRQRNWENRDKSVFGPVSRESARAFLIPKPRGGKAFEVVGIPLKAPGFYVVELQSELLGAALLGEAKPMYVSTTALVTNLSVHFKWGIDSSLVWVTTLDSAKPVGQAIVKVQDCSGKVLWEGRTDRSGVARMGGLPAADSLEQCSHDSLGVGLVVSARLGEDMAFVHSSWDDGIEPWRFRLPVNFQRRTTAAHTILDRSLFRAGETVHMKHLLRRRSTVGFGLPPENERPANLVIQHLGSDQRFEIKGLAWDARGAAESTWVIPAGAKLGEYQLYLSGREEEREQHFSGSFRVEEFRVPLLKGVLRPPADPLVSVSSAPLDITVSYLSGGGAGNLPVRLRYDIQPQPGPFFDDFADFVFSNGPVREGLVRGYGRDEEGARSEMRTTDLTLDRTGSVRTAISDLPKVERPQSIVAELEFRDPNGEVQTVSTNIPLWAAKWHVGLQPDSWALSKDALKFRAAVVDLLGKPIAGAPVKVDLLQRKSYSHRKRLVGGFYAYEHSTEVKKVLTICEGVTDARGLLLCERPTSLSGNVILQAEARDPEGNAAVAHRDVWVGGGEEWWFESEDGDRMDLLPEAKRYEPGQRAKFQVRMPFRKATVLITVEREGVADTFVRELSGKEPVIEIPIKGNYAPNAYVSVLAVRGRVGGVKPTALIDLGRPAYKLGIAEISVGWRAHELKVKVSADRPVYRVREKAAVSIAVTTPEGSPAPAGSEVAIAAVDEGLLELKANETWNLLEAMMARRSYGVSTATAQGRVVGKRHFGLKALPQGGGGGKQPTRELFDTLLFWSGRVRLDVAGRATVEIPLNDALTSFRIVAVATSGLDRFGTGSTSIRSTQDLMILSGLAPVVRQGDSYRPVFTLRNAAERAMQLRVTMRVKGLARQPEPASLTLAPGESRELAWNITIPAGVESLRYDLEAAAEGGMTDRLGVSQRVVPAVPVRAFQATLVQVDREWQVEVERPAQALAGRGGIEVSLKPRLAEGLTGVRDYMRLYPYTCLEQEVSRAVALRDSARWDRIMAALPAYLDSDGLAKYWPNTSLGSEVLTAYILSIANEAGWVIPPEVRERMQEGLKGFVEGKIVRRSALPTADLTIRKLAALEAISRTEAIKPEQLSSITIEPNLWPTSAVIDWLNILSRAGAVRDWSRRIEEADQILRSRLNFQGTTMGFSTERTDYLWWLMVSADSNAARLALSRVNSAAWKEDLPRLVTGVLGRQRRGHWMSTVANAWGILAMEKFSQAFESAPVTGTVRASLGEGKAQSLDWAAAPRGKELAFDWPTVRSALTIRAEGTGRPWATVRSLAAIPVKEPISSGYKIRKTLVPIDQKERGAWSRGDTVRVRLEMEAQADMTWVVVSDPIPAGAAILGGGLGRDSRLLTRGEESRGWAWPAFEERSAEAYRAYYDFVPKGSWTIEYTMRLNAEGAFSLPPTRVEAMYATEMFGEIPNTAITVGAGERAATRGGQNR